ncbi:EamA family transporter [Geodermatophilus sp. SYSU D00703]
MTTAGTGRRAAADGRRRPVLRGVGTMLGSALSNQVGAALGAHAFAAIGPPGVVAVRQVVAAAVLLPVARPPLRRMTRAQWWPVLLLAVVFGCMNLALYTAIDRIGLGLAVTLEFLGPLAVALAGSRSRRDLLIAVAAAAGVYLLVLPGPSSDFVGLGIGVLGGACWAAYIVLNRVAGARLPGLQAPAVATALCALAYLPVLVLLLRAGRLDGAALGHAVAAGVLASVVPYAADLIALRVVPQRSFGVFMSVHPVLAALVGTVLLGQLLAAHEWLGIAVVVGANAAAVAGSGRRAEASGPGCDDPPRAEPAGRGGHPGAAARRRPPSGRSWGAGRCGATPVTGRAPARSGTPTAT